MTETYKVCFIGGPKTGKTCFLLRHLSGEFREDYKPTIGVEVHPLKFSTNYGCYQLNIWDTAGQEKYGGLRDGYYIKADAAVAFYTLDTIEQTNQLVKDFKRVCNDAPIINVWSQSDIKNVNLSISKTAKTNIELIRQGQRPTYQISAKSNYNFEKPFQEILRKLTKKSDLIFIDSV